MRNCLIYLHGLKHDVVLPSCYDELLEDVGDVITPKVDPGRDHVYHLYVIRTENRDSLREYLTRGRYLHCFELP